MSERPILVLGSNSFSGASFCAYLLQQGEAVLAVSRSEEPVEALLPYKWKKCTPEFYQLDINYDLDRILALVKERKIQSIYNFAAQSMVAESWLTPEHWFETNVVSTIKLHDALRKVDTLERYVHISTPEVYGDCEGLVKEGRSYNPSTPYAVSRAAADMSLHSFYKAYEFPVVFTRAANVYGEGQQVYRIIPKTILYALTGRVLPLHGGGHSVRSFIHIDDVCRATHGIGKNGTLGEIYHISTERTVTVRALVDILADMLQVPFEQLCSVADERLGKDSAYLLDTQKIRQELKWMDKITLENGLERTIDWVKKYKNELLQLPQHYLHKA
jgi:dTDP-glucose 4,6-dehydratase